MELGKIKIVIAIVIGLITISGAIIGFENYFAKDAEVKEDVQAVKEDVKEEVKVREENDELINERVDLAISDDRVFQQEQQIQQMENYQIFEQRSAPVDPTPMEKEALKQAGVRLGALKAQRAKKVRRYEERRMAK